MKKLALAAALAFAATSLAAKPITFDDMAAMRRVGAPQVSPDGKWIAFDASNIDMAANYRKSAIYLVPAAGGASQKITEGARRDESPAWSPDGKSIAFVSNREGTAQVYVYDVASKATRKISNLAADASSVKWLPDGSGVLTVTGVYTDCGATLECNKSRAEADEKKPSKARVIDGLMYRHWNDWVAPTKSHVVVIPMSGAARDLTPGAFDAPPFSVGGGDEFDVSPDGKELVFARNTDPNPATSTNSDLFIVPLAGGEPKRITTRTGADTAPKYSPDGKYIAYTSQSRAGYESDLSELWVYNRADGKTTRIGAAFSEWVESITWLPDSKSVIVTAPERGKTSLYEVPASGTFRRIYGGQGSTHSPAVSPDGKTIYFGWDSLRRPTEIFSVARLGGSPKQISHENDELLTTVETGETADMAWTSGDGIQIQGHLIKPPNFDASKKYPALVLIHGGPQGAWGDAWSYRWNPQIFASRGYVVLMPNPRGSSGFGQKFVEDISGDWAGKVYTDIMNGVDALVALPFVDGTRLGAAGGSYGGYMVDWILGHSDRFKALVSHAGVYNLESMYGVTEELWFPEWEFKGTPWDAPDLYTRLSPHKFARNFKTPTLVTHGELDFRVPVDQGMQLFTALQRRGIPSRLILFPDEGHWVLKPQNSKVWFQQVGDWFDKYLK